MSPKEIRIYGDEEGFFPYLDWINHLKDPQTKARIQQRLRRLELGNFGVCKSLGEGIFELKCDFGPGYRVYYALESQHSIILLGGGSKASQDQDIAKAKQYWKLYKEKYT